MHFTGDVPVDETTMVVTKTMDSLRLHEASPFEQFLLKTRNVPDIWKNIMSDFSGLDVANCLRVCWNLRLAVRQCLETNSRLRYEMDLFSTNSAYKKGQIKSRTIVDLNKDITNYPGNIWALDGVWFKRQASIFRVCPNVNKAREFFSLAKDGKLSKFFQVYPTGNDERFLLLTSAGLSLIKLGHEHTESLCDPEPTNGDLEIPQMFQGPARSTYVRYRLFARVDGHSSSIVMALLDDQGEMTREVVLYQNQVSITQRKLACRQCTVQWYLRTRRWDWDGEVCMNLIYQYHIFLLIMLALLW